MRRARSPNGGALMRKVLNSVIAGLLLGLAACGGGGVIKAGEECQTVGSTEECNDGAICGEDKGITMCLKLCNDNSQCAADLEECGGIAGSMMRGCKTKEGVPM
jgi:hypothetical protein